MTTQTAPRDRCITVYDMMWQPLETVLAMVGSDTPAVAELREAIAADLEDPVYRLWLDQYAPVLGRWVQLTVSFERRHGRPRKLDELSLEPLLNALGRLYRFSRWQSVVDDLPTDLPEWDDLADTLERCKRAHLW